MKRAHSKISVLLPVHNGEGYLREAVESVLTQTFVDFQLLALDDGSTDRSLSILREFEAKDSRVHVISRDNRGLSRTLNELIAAARGCYLARMDSDDVCWPQRFEKQILYLETHPDCVAVGSKCLAIDPEGMPIREFVNVFTHDDIDSAHLFGIGRSQMCHPSLMMRRDAVLRVGQYNEEYLFSQDFDLLLRLAEIGKLANLPEVLLKYRLHFSSISYARTVQQQLFAQKAMRMALERRGITPTAAPSITEMQSDTKADVHRRWAWGALSAGNLMTARKHAINAFVARPLNFANLRVLACAIRGY